MIKITRCQKPATITKLAYR